MATIQKHEGKRGTSYKITVSVGRDAKYKQVRHFMTWKPPQGMPAREVNRELQRVAAEFEQDILGGFKVDNKQTFAEYAAYCYKLREDRGDKPQTLERIRRQTERINEYIGHMVLQKIMPQHLTEMYRALAAAGSNRHVYAAPLVDFRELVGGSPTAFARKCGVSVALVYRLFEGRRISRENAASIEKALGKKGLFELVGKDEPISPGTVRQYHAVVCTVFKQAYKEMIIKFNPTERATLPKQKRVREVRTLQPEQLKAVLAALETEPLQFRTLITLLMVTGCRRGEALALTWDKVDFAQREILVDESMSYLPGTGIQSGTTKTENSRRVAIPQEMAALLRKLWAEQAQERLKLGDMWENNDLVFTRWNGKPLYPNSVNVSLGEFCERHDLPHINPHLFRHSAASVLLANGVDVLTVAAMLGHANASMTLNTYAHAIDEMRHKTADCISETILHEKQA